MRGSYGGETSGGPEHSADTKEILEIQYGLMSALAKLFRFTFWSIIAPGRGSLPEAQEHLLTGRRIPGYLSVLRQEKEKALSVAGDGMKDYTDSFSGVADTDLFDMYIDGNHLTDRGNEIIAERRARDILRAFGGGETERT
jgi:hypothetical protein